MQIFFHSTADNGKELSCVARTFDDFGNNVDAEDSAGELAVTEVGQVLFWKIVKNKIFLGERFPELGTCDIFLKILF